MKKMILAAAVVCAAVASQAATFQWSTTAKAYGPAVANLFTPGSYSAGTTSSDYMKNEANNNGIAWTYTMILTTGTESDTLTGTVSSYSSNKINETVNSTLFALPTSGEKTYSWDIVITGTKTVGDYTYTITSGNITGSAAFSSLSPAAIESAAPSTWTVAKTSPEPTPEPTSGLLLALGMAGLALRRRRA